MSFGMNTVVEDDQHFVAAINLVANVDVIVLLGLAGVAGLTAEDQGDALCIGRAGKRNRVILVTLTHGDGRHNEHIVAVQVAGLVRLGAGDKTPSAVRALNYMQEQIRIRLLGRGQARRSPLTSVIAPSTASRCPVRRSRPS